MLSQATRRIVLLQWSSAAATRVQLHPLAGVANVTASRFFHITPMFSMAKSKSSGEGEPIRSSSTIHPRGGGSVEIPIEDVSASPSQSGATPSKIRVPMVDPVTEEMTEVEVEPADSDSGMMGRMAESAKQTADQAKGAAKETMGKASEAAKGTINQMKKAAAGVMNKATDAVKDAAASGTRSLNDGVSPGKQGFMGASTGAQVAQMNTSRLGSEDRQIAPVEQLIVKDHAIIKLLYSEYSDAIDVAVKKRKVYALIHEMARHNAQEELVVYPFLRTDARIPNGASIAERSMAEHEQLHVNVKTLDRLASDITVPQFTVMLSETMEEFTKHAAEEENEVLSLLVQHLSRSERLNLGEHFSNAATLVTTRPHPLAPKEGAAAVAAHLASKPLDIMRDILTGREDAIKKEAAEASRKVEGAMAANPPSDM